MMVKIEEDVKVKFFVFSVTMWYEGAKERGYNPPRVLVLI
jgi:hypothetical protein